MKACIFVILLLLLSVSLISADNRDIASADFLPLGDWTYDAMGSLAADGLVPGFSARIFQGDRLFNRMDMARIVAETIESLEFSQLSQRQASLIGKLTLELKPELLAIDADMVRETAKYKTNFSGLGYNRLTASKDSADQRIPVTYRATGFLDIAPKSFAIATLADNERKFFLEHRNDRIADKFFVRGYERKFNWSVGREYLSWGPSYTGSHVLSDNSPAFDQIRAGGEINLGRLLGRWKVTQMTSAFTEDGKRLHLFGRRWERPIGDFRIGVTEMTKANKMPSPLFFVIPFYLYQHLNKDMDVHLSCLYAADFSYSFPNRANIYGELAIDDMTQPSAIGGGFERPRKFAYTIGFHMPFSERGDSSIRAEYILVDRQTHEATRPEFPELAYTHKGFIIGHPIGRNAKAIYLRGEHPLSEKISLTTEYFNQWQKEPGEPEREKKQVFSIMGAYDFSPDKSVGLRIAPYSITPPGELSQKGTRYEIFTSFAF